VGAALAGRESAPPFTGPFTGLALDAMGAAFCASAEAKRLRVETCHVIRVGSRGGASSGTTLLWRGRCDLPRHQGGVPWGGQQRHDSAVARPVHFE
jgi:hypothetical protein